jgi:mono/diheme cytochrome c family protein
VRADNLGQLEESLWSLGPPHWPDAILGKIDMEIAAKGSEVYKKHCASCHAVPTEAYLAGVANSADQDPTIIVPYAKVGTDPNRILNSNINVERAADGTGGVEFIKALQTTATSLTQTALADSAMTEAEKAKIDRPMIEWQNTKGYVARPLVGVWATAPYLHNASVPTLWDLLNKPQDRPKSFFVGYREFDPEKVGYRSSKDEVPAAIIGQPPIREFSTTVNGNSNLGHEYGTELSDADKRALLMYLKTL